MSALPDSGRLGRRLVVRRGGGGLRRPFERLLIESTHDGDNMPTASEGLCFIGSRPAPARETGSGTLLTNASDDHGYRP